MIPAFSAWIESPEPGISTSSTVSAIADHLDLALPRADRLEEDELLARSVENEQRLQRRLGEPAEVAAGAHRANEHLRVEEVVGEPDPVAEQRALRERARWVDRDDADRPLRRADVPDERARSGSTCRPRAGP